jgi:hypothetical protein
VATLEVGIRQKPADDGHHGSSCFKRPSIRTADYRGTNL